MCANVVMEAIYFMAKVKNVEKKIWDVEGFDVVLKYNGKDLRGDKAGLPQFENNRASKSAWTVSEWKIKRFQKQYPGYEVEILDGDGNEVRGNMTLGNVRDSYDDGSSN